MDYRMIEPSGLSVRITGSQILDWPRLSYEKPRAGLDYWSIVLVRISSPRNGPGQTGRLDRMRPNNP